MPTATPLTLSDVKTGGEKNHSILVNRRRQGCESKRGKKEGNKCHISLMAVGSQPALNCKVTKVQPREDGKNEIEAKESLRIQS